MQCDLCGKVNQLGPRGAGNSIYQHRDSVGCKARVIRQTKEGARARLRVSYVYYDWLDFEPDQYVIRIMNTSQNSIRAVSTLLFWMFCFSNFFYGY